MFLMVSFFYAFNVTASDNSLLQSWGHNKESHYSWSEPDCRPAPRREEDFPSTTHNCWQVRRLHTNFQQNTPSGSADVQRLNSLTCICFVYALHTASYMPYSKDQNGNFPEKVTRRIKAQPSGWHQHSAELLQLQNLFCLCFPAPLICESNDSANSLGILVFASRICPATSVVSLAICMFVETQSADKRM